MKHSADRILTTHVGSLLRPVDVLGFMKAKGDGEAYDKQAFAAVLDQAVPEVVREQAQTGIDLVDDGEFGRTSFMTYLNGRLAGYEMRPATKERLDLFLKKQPGPLMPSAAREREQFADFYRVWTPVERSVYMPPEIVVPPLPTSPTELAVCTAPIRYTGLEELRQDLNRFKAALDEVDVEGGFVTAASAPLAAWGRPNNEYYATYEEYLFALADALNTEYRAITDAGLDLQIDSPELTHLYDPAQEGEYLKWLDLQVEAINRSLKGIPEDKARLHICWGSWNAPHTTDVPLRLIINTIFKIKTQGYSLEGANDRHEHEVLIWEDVRLPEEKILLPGVIGHVSNVVEHPELVAWRIRLYAERVGKENVIASTDCGFSQGWTSRRVHPQVQWAKLQALADGARIATQQLWGA